MKKLALLILLFPLVFAGCKDQSEKDRELILEYISDNNLDALEGAEGLFYVIDSVGTGEQPDLTNQVTVDYEGYLLDGTIFDSSIQRGSPATFPLTGVIRGWQLGIPLFREGGSGVLIIPSELAYGNTSPSTLIPRNAVLVFDVNLLEVIE